MASNHVILVPVTNDPASLEAVSVACVLARQRKSKVFAVHVIEVLRSLPLNAEMDADARRGEQLLRKAEEIASSVGSHLEGELLQAREAGQAIVDEARDRKADTIVIGLGHKRVIGEFMAGRTAEFVLKHAPSEVILVRQGAVPRTQHEHEQEHK